MALANVSLTPQDFGNRSVVVDGFILLSGPVIDRPGGDSYAIIDFGQSQGVFTIAPESTIHIQKMVGEWWYMSWRLSLYTCVYIKCMILYQQIMLV